MLNRHHPAAALSPLLAPGLKIYMNTQGAPLHPPHPPSPPSSQSLPIYTTKVSGMAALAPLRALPQGAGRTVTSLQFCHSLWVPRLPPSIGTPSPSATSSGRWGRGGVLSSHAAAASCASSPPKPSHFKPHRPGRSLARDHVGPRGSVALRDVGWMEAQLHLAGGGSVLATPRHIASAPTGAASCPP